MIKKYLVWVFANNDGYRIFVHEGVREDGIRKEFMVKELEEVPDVILSFLKERNEDFCGTIPGQWEKYRHKYYVIARPIVPPRAFRRIPISIVR